MSLRHRAVLRNLPPAYECETRPPRSSLPPAASPPSSGTRPPGYPPAGVPACRGTRLPGYLPAGSILAALARENSFFSIQGAFRDAVPASGHAQVEDAS